MHDLRKIHARWFVKLLGGWRALCVESTAGGDRHTVKNLEVEVLSAVCACVCLLGTWDMKLCALIGLSQSTQCFCLILIRVVFRWDEENLFLFVPHLSFSIFILIITCCSLMLVSVS